MRNDRRRLLVLGWLLTASAGLLVYNEVSLRPQPPSDASGPPNIILISIDTLRADHLGCYGYDRPTSPAIDRLAQRSLVFENAYALASWTLPSHVSIFTGRHPYALGILDLKTSTIPEDVPVVGELLTKAGYRTVALVDSVPNALLGANRGFARGFGEYDHLPERSSQRYRYDMRATTDAAIEWLGEHAGSAPFFMFLHTKSVHALPSGAQSPDPRMFPYDKPEPYRSRFVDDRGLAYQWSSPEFGSGVEYLRGLSDAILRGQLDPASYSRERIGALVGLYDGGIAYTDEQIGRLLSALDGLGLTERTAVIITSDHGEAFLEHRLPLHKELYRQLLHVPLIIHLPWAAEGRRLGRRVTLMDVLPTLLELGRAEAPAALQGTSLLSPARPDVEGAPSYSYYRVQAEYPYEAYGIRDGEWTLIHQRLGAEAAFETELFHSATDPDELEPITDRPEITARLLGSLSEWRAQGSAGHGVDGGFELDAAARDHLRALGYIGDGK